jgi:signal transduction histidine kinase
MCRWLRFQLLASPFSINEHRSLRHCLLACAVLLWSFSSAQGQVEGDPVLTQVAEVLALPEAEASSGTRTVKLSGIVTYVTASNDDFALQNGPHGISVAVGSGMPIPELGAVVEVEGSVFSETYFERKRSRIKLNKLTVLSTGELPAAAQVGVEQVAGFKHLDQWVSVEGTVMQVRSSMSLFTVQIVDKTAVCNVLVRDWPRENLPRDWIGGRVRFQGVNRAYLPGNGFLSLVVPSPAQVTVLKTGVTDPMDAKPTTTQVVRGMDEATRAERVKLTGTLLGATTGNVFYTRTADGDAFSFYMLHPIDEDKSGRYSTPIVMPKCNPGDLLEVVGLPAPVEHGVHLNFSVVRVVSQGAVPTAIPTDIATITAGKYVHDLVEVHGELLSLDDVLVAPGKWRTTMRLKEAEQTIIAFLDAPVRGALADFPIGHVFKVEAVVTGEPHFPEIRLWVRAPQDMQSLGVAEADVTRHLWTGLGIAALATLILAGWVVMLRRSRRIVSELNASLETRVAQRTAELAAAKEELAKALSQERELSELKTRFVSLVSHEFRTPLGVTMSAVEVLRHYDDRLTKEKKAELHEDIHSATLQMSGLMEQVLLLGKAEAGKILWQAAPVDLPELCQRIVDEVLAATHHRCPVELSVEGDFDGAKMDAALVRHIASNLLSNAVKYSPEGSPVHFTLRAEGGEAVLTVQDRGIGIPEEDQARLYEAFHRIGPAFGKTMRGFASRTHQHDL